MVYKKVKWLAVTALDEISCEFSQLTAVGGGGSAAGCGCG